MGWSNHGVFMVAAIERGRLTLPLARRLADALVEDTPFVGERDRGTERQALRAARIAEGTIGIIHYDWVNTPMSGQGMAALHVAGYRPMNPPLFEWAGYDVRSLYVYEEQLPPEDPQKVAFIVDRFRRAVDVLEPEYALIDHFGRYVFKPNRRGVDLRRFAWGVSVYGPALVKQLGRERLLGAPAWGVEELPWGGVWVQAAENPFAVPAAVRKPIEKHLGLAEAFSGPGGLVQHAPKGRLS